MVKEPENFKANCSLLRSHYNTTPPPGAKTSVDGVKFQKNASLMLKYFFGFLRNSAMNERMSAVRAVRLS